MADEKEFKIRVITPDRIFFEGKGSMIEMNTTEGEIGCYPMHVPTTVVMAPGIVSIHDAVAENDIPEKVREDGTLIAAVHAGFAEILNDRVTIMAEVAEWPSEIDVSRAREAEKRAKDRIEAKQTNTDFIRAEFALKKSLVRQQIKGMGL